MDKYNDDDEGTVEGSAYQSYFETSSCTCEHEPGDHSWNKCVVEGCTCQGHWSE